MKKGFEMEKEESLVKRTAKELGITQKELAERIGVDSKTIYNWENKKTEMPKMAIKLFDLMILENEYKNFVLAVNNGLQRFIKSK
jgi:DNA-binding XRE family transcriptional regulator